jgi:hypothetical protein
MLSIRTLFLCGSALDAVHTVALGAYALKMHKYIGCQSEEELATRIRQFVILSPLVRGAFSLASACFVVTWKDRFVQIMITGCEILFSFMHWKAQKGEKVWFFLEAEKQVLYGLGFLIPPALIGYGQFYAWRTGVTGEQAFKRIDELLNLDHEYTVNFPFFERSIGTFFLYSSTQAIRGLIEWSHRRRDPLKHAGLNAALGMVGLGCLFFAILKS